MGKPRSQCIIGRDGWAGLAGQDVVEALVSMELGSVGLYRLRCMVRKLSWFLWKG
jgi:hypothetical protein